MFITTRSRGTLAITTRRTTAVGALRFHSAFLVGTVADIAAMAAVTEVVITATGIAVGARLIARLVAQFARLTPS